MTAQPSGGDDLALLTEFAQWVLFDVYDEPGYRLPVAPSTSPLDATTNGREGA